MTQHWNGCLVCFVKNTLYLINSQKWHYLGHSISCRRLWTPLLTDNIMSLPKGEKNTQMYWINNESCWARSLEFMQCSASLGDQVMKPILLTLFQMKHVMACAAIIAFLAGGEVNTRIQSVCFCQLLRVCVIFRVSQQAKKKAYFASDCFAFFSSSSMERSAQKAHTMCHLQREEKARFCALFETETVESFCNLKQPS